jgi:uncharacterized membrane protein
MADLNKLSPLKLVAINKNEQIRKLSTFGDKVADAVTSWAGSTPFLVLNIIWFVTWILVNTGTFGKDLIFDEYPFGFLTMVVSLEAIILAVFVLISQNRQSARSEIRAELDYIADLQADAEITAILRMLERLADKENIEVADVLQNLAVEEQRILKEHPVTQKDLEA